MPKLTSLGLGAVALGLALNLGATPPPENAAISSYAMTETESRFFDHFALGNTKALSQYTKVYVEMPDVSFDKHWLKEHRTKVSSSYKKNTLERYGKLMQEQLVKAIEKDGRWQIVETPAADALTMKVTVADLDIHGPDDNSFVRHYVNEAGDARLFLEVVSPSGELLAKFEDHRETRERGFGKPQLTSRVLNYSDFRFLMKRWSKEVVEHIHSAS